MPYKVVLASTCVSLYMKLKCVSFDMQVKFNLGSILCGIPFIKQSLQSSSNIDNEQHSHVHTYDFG